MLHIRHRWRQCWASAARHGHSDTFLAHFLFPIGPGANIVA
jgi:hypothetical protein